MDALRLERMRVLLIESEPGSGVDDAIELTRRNHQVFRCYHDGDTLCAGITRGACPLDASIDVALIERDGAASAPTAFETGAVCAIRQGVPLVERGSLDNDPYGPWLSGRVFFSAPVACARALDARDEGLTRDMRGRLAPLLEPHGIDPEDVSLSCRIEHTDLQVVVHGPDLSTELRNLITARVTDNLTSTGRDFARISVAYEAAA